ncbi:MAG: polysaccharide ABC transporter ATP-binding protein [Synechococcales bacterium]|nr:polysaccharide ABC transporter ATP-binding protein [Synechococcales bacterium]
MADEILVKVEGVSKKYCKDLKRSLRYGLQDLAGELLLKHRPHTELRRQEFWALQDVNFELRRGESFGVIGVNGSGKTTLLKILQGLIKPTTGRVTIRGKVSALITLGAGFQPLLTGRENIYVNAAILGIPHHIVDKRINDILEFAEIGDFIDAPVKTYSSGMKGRLGFAVATNLTTPDVLLLDEVLATGDWKFKERCFQRMEEIVNSGATIVFVSHLVPKVEQLCNRVLLLHKGVVKALGNSSEVCEVFESLPDSYTERDLRLANRKRKQLLMTMKKTPDQILAGHVAEPADQRLEITAIELLSAAELPQEKFQTLETLIIRTHYLCDPQATRLKLAVQFLTVGDEISIAHFESFLAPHAASNGQEELSGYADCVVPELALSEGRYRVSVTLIQPTDAPDTAPVKVMDLVSISVVAGDRQGPGTKEKRSLVYMPSSWRFGAAAPQQAPASIGDRP